MLLTVSVLIWRWRRSSRPTCARSTVTSTLHSHDGAYVRWAEEGAVDEVPSECESSARDGWCGEGERVAVWGGGVEGQTEVRELTLLLAPLLPGTSRRPHPHPSPPPLAYTYPHLPVRGTPGHLHSSTEAAVSVNASCRQRS